MVQKMATILLNWLIVPLGESAWEKVMYHRTAIYTYHKDHQRMMVDPTFMIIQSLRSFLTAVAQTAVTQTAVIPFVVILLDFTFFSEFTCIHPNLP